MTLAEARGGAGVTAVLGRMVYELTGSACEGYTQNMRFVTQMTNQKGTATLTDLRSSSWEEGSGKRFRFNSSQFRDEKPTEATAGDAARANAADAAKVELTKPVRSIWPYRSASISQSSIRSPCLMPPERASGPFGPISTMGPKKARRSMTPSP